MQFRGQDRARSVEDRAALLGVRITADSGGRMGDTFRYLRGARKCRGGSVARSTNACGLWLGCPRGRRWAFTVFERIFKDFGLPLAIRTDNGVPFASRSTFFGLSKLPVWWLRLGIGIERTKPGNLQQNGRHERMHLTLPLRIPGRQTSTLDNSLITRSRAAQAHRWC
jgi:transposase InsO family protein